MTDSQMENNFFHLLNIKAATLIAGLLGALITMMRKSQGSLQARITGYLIAIITVLYLVPFIIYLIDWKFGIILHASAENLVAFICGMVAQTITENFVDDPLGSIYKYIANFSRIKRMVWNGEPFVPPSILTKEDSEVKND